MPQINLSIIPAPQFVPQNPKVNGCWAAVSASALGWSQNVSLSMAAAASQLGPYFAGLLQNDQALPANKIAEWAAAAKLTALPPTNITVSIIQSVLSAGKPLIIFKGTNQPNLGHAVVVYKLVGDGSINTNITFVDPAIGGNVSQTLAAFGPQFEQLVPPPGQQIFAQMFRP
jgi:hypothetical protein